MKKKASYVMGSAIRKESKIKKEKKAKDMSFNDWKKMMESGRTRY